MRIFYLTRMTFYLMVVLILFFSLYIPIDASLAIPSQSQTDGPQYTLRIGAIVPAGISYTKYVEKLFNKIELLSNHKIKIELSAGGVLGDETAMLKMVQDGELDGAFISNFSLGEIAPETIVLSLPYLFRDEHEVDFIIGKYESTFAGYARSRGIEILGVFGIGTSQILSTIPILDPDELRDKKVMYLGKSEIAKEYARWLRLRFPVPLSFSQVESAFKSGKVQVVVAPPAAVVIMGWYPYIRYAVMEAGFVAVIECLFNADVYGSLPEKIRSTLSTFIREDGKQVMKLARRDDEIAMLGLMKRGVKIIRWSPEDMEKMRKNAKAFWDYGVGKWYSRKLLDDIVQDLEAYRAAKGTGENKKH